MKEKLHHLQGIIKEMASLLVAYSGGVDSTFLLKVAKDTLGEKVVAVTARSLIYPPKEYEEACELTERLKVRHLTIISHELDMPEFSSNPPHRCYYCKRELFSRLSEIALREGMNYVADGSNVDDGGDFRSGMRAATELGVSSPLKEAGLAKEDIRSLSLSWGLPTWDKPSLPCLATRFPYGDNITPEGLEIVSQAEEYLHSLGFKQLRVRHHQHLARIEVPAADIRQLGDDSLRILIVRKFKELGYTYVTLDIQGYRRGSMNEVL